MFDISNELLTILEEISNDEIYELGRTLRNFPTHGSYHYYKELNV